jgi:dTDP-4-dehydrorhamnose 3,5-epimerase
MILVEKTHLKDLVIIHNQAYRDSRGSFHEAYNFMELVEYHRPIRIDQVNVSMSIDAGTVRGMHWQEEPFGQTKIVRCIHGEIQDVVVDLRRDSPTYGQHKSIYMKADDLQAVFIPPGFAHGWQAVKECSQIEYFVNGPWKKEAERGLQPEDPDVGITWAQPVVNLNPRDASWPLFKNLPR